jgi:hypothetical protein
LDLAKELHYAWALCRRDRALWILRALTGSNLILAGSTAGSVLLLRLLYTSAGHPASNFDRWLAGLISPGPVALLIVLVGAAYLTISFFDTLGRVALMQRLARGMQDPQTKRLWTSLRQAIPFLWPARKIHAVLGAPDLLVFFFLALSLLLTLGLSALCLAPLLPFLLPVDWVFKAWSEASLAMCVLEKRSWSECLQEGWRRVRAHWKTYSLLALVLRLGFGLVTLTLILLPWAIPVSLFFTTIVPGSPRLPPEAFILSEVVVLVGLGLLLLLNTILTSFTDTAWVVSTVDFY